jgi:hypothetical protein
MLAIDFGLNGRSSSASPIWRQLVSALDTSVDLVAVRNTTPPADSRSGNRRPMSKCDASLRRPRIRIVVLDRLGVAAKGAMAQGHDDAPSGARRRMTSE